MSELVAITERTVCLFNVGRNFCPPSLSDSDFSTAEFRISLCEMRRQEESCVCPVHPCAHNKFLLPFSIVA